MAAGAHPGTLVWDGKGELIFLNAQFLDTCPAAQENKYQGTLIQED